VSRPDIIVRGSVVVTIKSGKCAGCGAERMFFVNHGGKTVCAGCASLESIGVEVEVAP
jgi:hypothetical protein